MTTATTGYTLLGVLVQPEGNGMDLPEGILLFLGMALIGVRLLGLLNRLVAAVVTRALPETIWDDAMLLWAQGSAGLVTFWIGTFEMGGPWWAAAIVAFLVALTTFAIRRPRLEPEGAYVYQEEESY